MFSGGARRQFGYLLFLCFVGSVLTGAPLPRHDAPKCDSLSLDNCFKKLQVFLTLTNLPFVSESEELDKLCETAIGGYNCSQVLLQNPDCLSLQNKEILPVFISMAEFTYFMFCNNDGKDGYLRPAILENSECITSHKEELDCCSRETHVADLPILRILEESSRSMTERQITTCCPISRYIQCASTVALRCSESAANFTVEYIRRATGEQAEAVCQKLPNYPDTDEGTCSEPVPVCSSSVVTYLDKHALIICFVSFVCVLYQRINFVTV